MTILVLNGGSSSLKFTLFLCEGERLKAQLTGELSHITDRQAMLVMSSANGAKESRTVQFTNRRSGLIDLLLDLVSKAGIVDSVGYRVVHPGPHIADHVRITDVILKQMEAAVHFAPLHDPDAITIIRHTLDRLPDASHFACFDTVFHASMPKEASAYALAEELRAEGIKRYGFHGLS